MLTVLSVDGVNAVTGETASALQNGYVLDPWESTEINGWRKSLDEIAQYAAWFAGPHGDSANERTALGGLRHELTREPRHSAAVSDPA